MARQVSFILPYFYLYDILYFIINKKEQVEIYNHSMYT